MREDLFKSSVYNLLSCIKKGKMGDAMAVEEQRSILSAASIMPQPDTVSKMVRRIRALVTRLLPVEVELSDIQDATSSIITPEVIRAFGQCGGDFTEAIPFALLRARATFMRDAYLNPPDYGESVCRATACEVLARRIVHTIEVDRLESVMSTRFRYRESDGDASAPTSALETAIDQHCTIFLSSTEAQHVVNSLWRGDWVQRNNEDDDIDYVQYERTESWSFWDHVNPERISVPRYQSLFKIFVWIIFLFVYSQAVSSPLDTLDPAHQLDEWEYVLYIMTLSFLIEEAVKVVKTIRIATRPLATVNFWTAVSFSTDVILLSAFGMRVAGVVMGQEDNEQARNLQFRSFQLLSCAAPLIWMKLLTVFDGVKAVGTLQVVVFRMLRESAIFFILLAILGIGFMQSMYALDAADGESGGGIQVLNSLVQALLGSPDFDTPNERFGYPFGLIIYYSWNFLATIILVNVLIALFGSAYSDVVENATDEYLAFFASKTIGLIRAPDSFVYPAPFNLIEAILIAPFEFVLSTQQYIKLNRFIMSVLFCIPLFAIALFETQISHSRSERIRLYFAGPPPDEDGDPKVEDPESDDPAGEICTISFDDLVKTFPDTAITESAVVHKEMKALTAQIDRLERLISEGPEDKKGKSKDKKENKEAIKEALVDDK